MSFGPQLLVWVPDLSRGLLCISVREASFCSALEARTVPRHIFHLHTLNSLGEPRAVWIGDGSGFFGLFRGCWVVAWLCECVCVCART